MTLSSLQKYGKNFQHKTLKLLLSDKKFLINIIDILKPDFFSSEADKWLVHQIIQYFEEFRGVLPFDTIAHKIAKEESDTVRVVLNNLCKHLQTLVVSDEDYIKSEFLSFCKNQMMKEVIIKSAELVDSNQLDSIWPKLEHLRKFTTERDVGHVYKLDIESRYVKNERSPIPTPWPELNSVWDGGAGKGDLGIVMGSPGGGKSWMMVAIAGHALQLGKTVFYYTLELSEIYVARRFDAYLSGINSKEVINHKERVKSIIDKIKGNIYIKEYGPYGASIQTIKGHIQQVKDQTNHSPDIIIIDYLDYLRPTVTPKEERTGLDDVYRGAKALARELNIPVITPSQVNRQGANDNIIEGDKVAGSYHKLMIADFICTLARSKDDKVNGTGVLHVAKSRYGSDGVTFNIEMDAGTGHIQIIGNYTGENPQSATVQVQGKNLNIPQAAVNNLLQTI